MKKNTVQDDYYLPRIEESLESLSGISLVWISRMPFGTTHGPAVFQNFLKTKVKFIGHVISGDGIETYPEKVEALLSKFHGQLLEMLQNLGNFQALQDFTGAL